MNELESRWALPDLQSTINWCAYRNAQSIRCVIDALGGYARDKRQSADSVEAYLAAAKAISDFGLNASLTIKLSALGALFDRDGCRKNVQSIAQEAARLGVGFEIDMEGQGLVTYAIDLAAACAEKGHRVSLALQAYLDRTHDDLKRVSALGITARIVKGAYVGSTKDFAEIQQHFKELVKILGTQATFFPLEHTILISSSGRRRKWGRSETQSSLVSSKVSPIAQRSHWLMRGGWFRNTCLLARIAQLTRRVAKNI